MPLSRKFVIECDFCGHTEEFSIDNQPAPPKMQKWVEVSFATDPTGPNGQKTGKWYDSPDCATSGMKRDIANRAKEQTLAGVIA